MGVPGLGHRRSFGGSRPQTSPPRFPVAALCQRRSGSRGRSPRRRRSQTAATAAFARSSILAARHHIRELELTEAEVHDPGIFTIGGGQGEKGLPPVMALVPAQHAAAARGVC